MRNQVVARDLATDKLLREATKQAGNLNAALRKLHEAGIEVVIIFQGPKGDRPPMIVYLERKGHPFG